jgi:hypothetical protein
MSDRAWLMKHRRVDPVTGCWIFLGAVNEAGYGVIRWDGRNRLVHRVAMSIWRRFDLDDSQLVCHTCDNPPCWNPDHLFAGDGKSNAQDAARKGRLAGQDKTHCPQGHEYTLENVYRIKSRPYARYCRTCNNGGRRRNIKKKAAYDRRRLRLYGEEINRKRRIARRAAKG